MADPIWRIEMLGKLQAVRGEQVVSTFRSHKTGALLAYLALHKDSLRREVVAAAVWDSDPDRPDGQEDEDWNEDEEEMIGFAARDSSSASPPAASDPAPNNPAASDPEKPRRKRNTDPARVNLCTSLCSLRRQLEPPGEVPRGAVLVASRDTIRLNADAVTTDVREMQSALKRARLAQGEAEKLAHLGTAVEGYRGMLLPGYYEDWVLNEREHLVEQFRQAVLELMDRLSAQQQHARAIYYGLRGAQAEPGWEEAYYRLMLCYEAIGRPYAAVRQYLKLQEIRKKQDGVGPSERLVNLAERLRQGAQGSPDRKRMPETTPRPAVEVRAGTFTFLVLEPAAGDQNVTRDALASPSPERDVTRDALPDPSLEQVFSQHGGQFHSKIGSRVAAQFGRATDAHSCAVALQSAGSRPGSPSSGAGGEGWRAALDTCEIRLREGEDPAGVLRLATALLDAAHPGQILCSEETAALLRRDPEARARLAPLGSYRLPDRPERVFLIAYPGRGEKPFPPLKAPAGFTGALPIRSTRFFGRDAELHAIGGLLLSDPTRVVNLTGPGGTGKTRLAIEAARRIEERFRGCTWFVPLASIPGPEGILDAVRRAIGLVDFLGVDVLAAVAEELSRQRTLLVMDNFEHLVEGGVEVLAALLDRAESLRLLVTSQKRLNLEGEREYPVRPFPIPPENASLEELAANPAIQLFIDRAQAALPDFQLTAANAGTLRSLCARLEGLPLPIELAAAQVPVRRPAQMLSQIENIFQFLVAHKHGVDARHRSLQAAFSWSFDLLSPDLQRFFGRLSAFRGGCAPAAAEAVCEEPLAMDYLVELRESSLLFVDPDSDSLRFGMLDVLRRFAEVVLNEHDQAEARRRHARYFLELAENQARQMRTAGEAGALEEIGQEMDNLRAALRWSQENGQDEICVRLTLVLFEPFYRLGYWPAAQEALPLAYEAALRPGRESQCAALALYRAWLADEMGDREQARGFAEEGLAFSRKLGDPGLEADALNLLSTVRLHQGDPEAAEEHLRECLERIGADDRFRRGRALHNLGRAASLRGDLSLARQRYLEALQHRQAHGDLRGQVETLGNLGVIASQEGDTAAARRLHRESLALSERLGDRYGIGSQLYNLAYLSAIEGDLDRAIALCYHAETILSDLRSVQQRAPRELLRDLQTHVTPDRFTAALDLARRQAPGAFLEDGVTG